MRVADVTPSRTYFWNEKTGTMYDKAGREVDPGDLGTPDVPVDPADPPDRCGPPPDPEPAPEPAPEPEPVPTLEPPPEPIIDGDDLKKGAEIAGAGAIIVGGFLVGLATGGAATP